MSYREMEYNRVGKVGVVEVGNLFLSFSFVIKVFTCF